jgi:hypothetical protein
MRIVGSQFTTSCPCIYNQMNETTRSILLLGRCRHHPPQRERNRMKRRINNNNNTLRLLAVPRPVYLYSRAQRWGSISAYKDATPRLPFRPSCHGNDSRTVNNVPLRLSTDDGHRCSRGPYRNLPIHTSLHDRYAIK